MKYYVYVLYSEKYNKIYIGQTIDLANRLEWHNTKSTKGYTLKFRPWKIVYSEELPQKTDALKREKQLKTSRGRDFIWNEIIPNLNL